MNSGLVEKWLEAHTGLVAEKLGPRQVSRVVDERRALTGCVDAAAYVALLERTPAERLKLIDGIIVPETWFFRDRGAFEGLARHVTGPWAARHAGNVFRVLSVPCSSGEEAYSIVMELILHAHPMSHLTVDAVDIGLENIQQAKAGVYGRNAFREIDLDFRARYFERGRENTWQVQDRVRAPLRFRQANLFAADFAAGQLPYDAIFCRNLLIYFDRATQTRAFRLLAGLLAEDGLLAVGPAEGVLALDHGFSMQPGASMFLFRKTPAAAKPESPRGAKYVARPLSPPARVPMPAARPGAAVVGPRRWPEPTLAVSGLDTVRLLADGGHLQQAAQLGESLLQEKGISAELCYLVAVVADAMDDTTRAEEYYRKALYLAPDHHDAMVHLALIAGRRGDGRAAASLRARAHRAALLTVPLS